MADEAGQEVSIALACDLAVRGFQAGAILPHQYQLRVRCSRCKKLVFAVVTVPGFPRILLRWDGTRMFGEGRVLRGRDALNAKMRNSKSHRQGMAASVLCVDPDRGNVCHVSQAGHAFWDDADITAACRCGRHVETVRGIFDRLATGQPDQTSATRPWRPLVRYTGHDQ